MLQVAFEQDWTADDLRKFLHPDPEPPEASEPEADEQLIFFGPARRILPCELDGVPGSSRRWCRAQYPIPILSFTQTMHVR